MVQRDIGLTAEIYKMEKFTVAGEREGNALAITLQRQSDGVKNVVSADAFGNLAGNPADLLMRMPGIAGESVGGDIRFIRIRGLITTWPRSRWTATAWPTRLRPGPHEKCNGSRPAPRRSSGWR